MGNVTTASSGDGDVLLTLSGRLDPHPWIGTAGPGAAAEDAYSVCRSRVELMGWDTTFSSMPGDRQELFGLLDAGLADPSSDELGRFRVQPTQPAAVHRYLPALGVAVQDTIARFGAADVTAVMADLPAAPADPQSLPYLQQTLNWFGAAAPGVGRRTALRCEGPSAAQQRIGLERLGGCALTPFAVDRESAMVRLPEWTVTAVTWALAAVTAAVREADYAGDLRVRLRPE